MKRNSDPENDLVPAFFQVLHSVGLRDRVIKSEKFKTLQEAEEVYVGLMALLKPIVFSNVGLYVGDAQGYMNCLKHFIVLSDNSISEKILEEAWYEKESSEF